MWRSTTAFLASVSGGQPLIEPGLVIVLDEIVAFLDFFLGRQFLRRCHLFQDHLRQCRHFLAASVKPKIIVVMVQKEVAEAIVATPGQRSVLSISVQFYGKPIIVSYVPAQSFYPAPEVDSAIVRIDLYPQPVVSVTDERDFFALVRAGFAASRKQIVNSLAQGLGLPKTEVSALLDSADIAPQRRAETFTLKEWAQLWQVFARAKERK